MSSPFGTSNQGGYQGPPTSTQAAPQQGFGGGAGYGGYGGFGGFQSQPSYGGFGGGFGGFNPMFGGLGGLGFNPMMGMGFMQPMPSFGGFGGGYGGFGGFNPMFGGLGGLGFNPMMGGQFGMPMQGFNPYQQQQQNFGSFDMMYRGGPQMSPEMRQRREQDMRNMDRMSMGGFGGMGAAAAQAQRTPIQFDEKMPTEQDWNLHAATAFYAPNTDMEAMKRDFMSRPMRTPRNLEAFAQPTADQPRQQPMYGGLGGLGFNPMMGPQFGMPIGQRAQLLQDQRQFGYGQDTPQMQPKEDLSFEAFKASQPKSDPNDLTQFMTMLRPSQEQQYRSWLNSKITPNTNRQLMSGERPRQSISQSDVDSVYNRYLENSRPNAQMTQGGVPIAQLQSMLQGMQANTSMMG